MQLEPNRGVTLVDVSNDSGCLLALTLVVIPLEGLKECLSYFLPIRFAT